MKHNALQIRILALILFKTSVQNFEQHLTEKGIQLSMLQMGILRFVSHHPYTLSELSRKMMLDPSTLVPSINALVKKGYVTRERDPNDRRRMPLLLTDEGLTLIQSQPMMCDDDPLLASLQGLGQKKVEQLQQLLREAVASLPDGEQILNEVDARHIIQIPTNLD